MDAALITLHTTGHLRAVHKGTVMVLGQLDQAKISVTDFRTETVAIDVKGRIKLRKLFQEAGLSCKPEEEGVVAERFIELMDKLAAKAGGAAPLPECPKTTVLDSIRTLSGNEMLAALLREHDELKKLREQWQERGKLAEKRLPGWQTLAELLGHAKGVAEAAGVQAEADAVCRERRLLDTSDPVPAIHGQATGLLRGALKKAHAAVKEAFGREMGALAASDNWQKLSSGDQSRLLAEAGLVAPAELSIGDDSALLRELSARSLAEWKALADALPERFRQVAMAAARLLEPKAQSVRLSSGTLKTPEDVRAWLAEAEKELLAKLKDGPVVVN